MHQKAKSYADYDDDEIACLLKTVADHFDLEDRPTRERQIRHWRRLKLYWANFSQIYWSETAHDYRIYNRDTNSTDTDQDYYDKPVNIFRAFLETIIAALSIQVPGINCAPDDAENPLDISTAKAGDEIAELIYKHNDAVYVWLQALYIYCTEGLIAAYNYTDESVEYGTHPKPKFKDEEVEGYKCPNCGANLTDLMGDEYDPKEQDNDGPCSSCSMFIPSAARCTIHGPQDQIEPDGTCDFYEKGTPGTDGNEPRSEVTLQTSNYRKYGEDNKCIECGTPIDPELQKSKFIIKRLDGITQEPKSRVIIKVFGGLYVKVANYAKTQQGTPYLIWSYETHYTNALETWNGLRDKIAQGGWYNSGVNDPYEQYGRLNTQYRGEFPEENVTVKTCWLRPAAFNILDDDEYKKLKKKFPHGAKVVMVNEVVAHYCDECLDDHWTLAEDPLSDFLNKDPLGELLTNLQDITNDLISLTLQTIEHGITQTWADPAVVNFNAYKQIEATPGTITPTKPMAPGHAMSEAFHETKTAALAPEVVTFYKIIQELGQFVSGALPSIFGGNQQAGSSRTASEYAMSKGMALQRQQTPWRMMTIWWKKIFAKSIPMYMKVMKEDERVVKKNEQGNYINVFIRKAELGGTIGNIELEPDEKLPINDEQKADMIMQLLQLNNQQINTAIMDPDNLPYFSKIIKLPMFRMPGEEDRQKQLEEIEELVNAAPLPPDPASVQLFQQAQQAHAQNPNHGKGQPVQPEEQPSVPIDVDVDNHQIEATICKSWLIGPAGRQAKKENPNGYKNVLLHMKLHLAEVTKAIAAQNMHDDQMALAGVKQHTAEHSDPKGSVPPMKPKGSDKISGAGHAKTPIQ